MSEDIRLNVDFFTHHKTRRLRRKLGADAVLSLITLFCYVGKTRPEGALLGMDADDIADVSDWDGDAQDFVSELCSIGFLEQCEEGIYHVHEWDEHNPWAAEQTERSDKARNAANKRWDKVRADNAKSQAEHTSSNAHNNNELCSNDANAMLEQCKGNANAVPTQCPSAPLPFPKEVYSPHLTPPLGPPLAPPSPPLREPCADFMELREFYSSTCREEGANVGYAEFVQAVKSRDLESDIRDMEGFIPVEKYASGSGMEGEIGSVEGVRYLTTTMMTPFEDAGGTPLSGTDVVSTSGSVADVYPVFIFGKDAFGVTPFAKAANGASPVTPMVLNPNVPRGGDPLGQRGTIGWKLLHTAEILHDFWMIRLEVAASEL